LPNSNWTVQNIREVLDFGNTNKVFGYKPTQASPPPNQP